MQEPPQFDKSCLLERLGGDEEFLEEVVSLYLEETPKVLALLRRAVDERNPPDVMTTAHRLKGALLTLEAVPAAQLAERLEDMGRRAELAESSGVLSDLERTLNRLTEELSREMTAGG